MRTAYTRRCLASIFCVVIQLLIIQTVIAQTTTAARSEDTNRTFSKSELRPFSKPELRGALQQRLQAGKIKPDDEKYIFKEIEDADVNSMIGKWETTNHKVLSKEAKIDLLSEYFVRVKNLGDHYEKVYIFHGKVPALSSETVRVADYPPNFNSMYPAMNDYGDVKVNSNPEKAVVYFDNDPTPVGYSINTFVVPVGSHTVRVKKEGSLDCALPVQVEKYIPKEVTCPPP